MRLSDYNHMPPVASLMTPFPHFVEPGESLEHVSKLMQEYSIRHVPVKQGGTVIGMVSQAAVTAALRCGGEERGVNASDIQMPDPCIVEFTAPLSEMLHCMAEKHAAAVVVLKAGKLAGIVTASDICEALCQFIEDRFPGSEGAA